MTTKKVPCLAKNLHHIGIAVKDLDAVVAFYSELFGVTIAKSEEVASQKVKAVLLSVGGSNLEFLAATSPESTVARFIQNRGEGLHHICLEVDDIGEKLKALKAVGIELVDQTPRPGIAGTIAFLHPKSTKGILVELVQVE